MGWQAHVLGGFLQTRKLPTQSGNGKTIQRSHHLSLVSTLPNRHSVNKSRRLLRQTGPMHARTENVSPSSSNGMSSTGSSRQGSMRSQQFQRTSIVERNSAGRCLKKRVSSSLRETCLGTLTASELGLGFIPMNWKMVSIESVATSKDIADIHCWRRESDSDEWRRVVFFCFILH